MNLPPLSLSAKKRLTVQLARAEVAFASNQIPDNTLEPRTSGMDPDRAFRVVKALQFVHDVFFSATDELCKSDLSATQIRDEIGAFRIAVGKHVFQSRWPRLSETQGWGCLAPSDQTDFAFYFNRIIKTSPKWQLLQLILLQLAEREASINALAPPGTNRPDCVTMPVVRGAQMLNTCSRESREDRLQSFVQERHITIAEFRRQARVAKTNMQQWRKGSLSDLSVISQRIEQLLAKRVPLG